MVFSSAPLYLDPHNWHHHHHQQQEAHDAHQSQQFITTTIHDGSSQGDNNHDHHQVSVHMPPPQVPSQSINNGNTSSIKPGSMADRARQAKIPQPEPGLKCPRCQSTNTKFCYFNNYNLAQPRHFCKMCRRYWTKGGALRNVPVGGGFRKNSKKSSNKGGGRTGSKVSTTSPISSKSNNPDTNNNFNNHGNMLDNCTSLTGHQSFQPPMTTTTTTQFPLLASLQGLNHHHGDQYGSCTISNNLLGLNFSEMMSARAQTELGFHIGSIASSSVNNADHHQWRPNHFHNNFLTAFDPSQLSHRPTPSSSSHVSSLYHFPIGHQQEANNQQRLYIGTSSMSLKNSNDEKDNEAAAAVKDEEGATGGSNGGMNSLISRSFLGMSDNNQYWNANNNNTTTWSTDHSSINTSSTTHQ